MYRDEERTYGSKYCQGHRVKSHYCVAQCLECGESYCHCFFPHCCCPNRGYYARRIMQEYKQHTSKLICERYMRITCTEEPISDETLLSLLFPIKCRNSTRSTGSDSDDTDIGSVNSDNKEKIMISTVENGKTRHILLDEGMNINKSIDRIRQSDLFDQKTCIIDKFDIDCVNPRCIRIKNFFSTNRYNTVSRMSIDVNKLFGQFGSIRKVYIFTRQKKKNKNCSVAFVTYDCMFSANLAVLMMNGCTYENRKISVSFNDK